MISNILSKALSRLLTADVIGLVLLVAALQAFTYGVFSSLRNMNASQSVYFFWAGLIAILIALGLSKLQLNGIQAAAWIVAIGVAGTWILGARLTSPLLDLAKAIFVVTQQIAPALQFDIPIDTTGINATWRVIAEASGALSLRVQAWLASLNQGAAVNDALMRDLVWTLIMWLMAGWMGWFAGRRNAIAALLPSIVLLAVVTSYSELRIYTLWLMVSLLLLLMGLWNYQEHTRQWERKKVDYSDSIRYDVSQAVIFLTIIIGAITFVTPSISWREIRDRLREWNEPSQNEVADVLGIQKKPSASQSTSVQQPSLPRDHLLTGGFANSQDVVMTISTGELPPIPYMEFASSAPRYYWRSVIYDVYAGTGWVTSGAPAQKYQANTPLIQGLLHGYKPLHLDVQLVQPQGRLFWSGVLFSADVPFTANWRVRPQSNLFADQSDLLQGDMFAALSDQRSYRVVSYLPLVTLDELRAASTEYPEEISTRYLRLPTSLPERVQQLAADITKGKTNPYDKAKAIETYLRTYPYDLTVPGPPPDRDVADYFLFDLKRGYCDYYATAMVVLARSSGIPARFVSGYAPGSYDAQYAEYVVRELDAHSWPEIYFPQLGWIEFEPTASQAEIVRPASDVTGLPAPDPEATRILNRFKFGRIAYWLSPVAAILILFLLQFTVIERWRYLHLPPEIAIERMYRRLYRLGRPLAGERTRAETVYEFMQKLVSAIDRLRLKELSRSSSKLFSGIRQDVELLTDMYQDTLFSHNTIHKTESRRALQIWRRLRLQLLIARAKTLLQKKFKASSS